MWHLQVVHGVDDVMRLINTLLMVQMSRVGHLLGQHGFLKILTLSLLVRVGACSLMLGVKLKVVHCICGMVDRRQILRTFIKEVPYVGGGLFGMTTSIDHFTCHNGHSLSKLVNTEAVLHGWRSRQIVGADWVEEGGVGVVRLHEEILRVLGQDDGLGAVHGEFRRGHQGLKVAAGGIRHVLRRRSHDVLLHKLVKDTLSMGLRVPHHDKIVLHVEVTLDQSQAWVVAHFTVVGRLVDVQVRRDKLARHGHQVGVLRLYVAGRQAVGVCRVFLIVDVVAKIP